MDDFDVGPEPDPIPPGTRNPYRGSWGDWVWNRERHADEERELLGDDELPDYVFTRLADGWAGPARCPQCHAREGGCRHYPTPAAAYDDLARAAAAAGWGPTYGMEGDPMMKADERRLLEELLRQGDAGNATTLAAALDIPEHRIEYILAKWAARGWWEYGVSLWTGWLTPKAALPPPGW